MKQHNRSFPTILLIIPYFGKWPEWFLFYLETCRWNSTIDWLFFTDCQPPENAPANTKFHFIEFSDYKKLVSERLKINFDPPSPYKLCDIKPAYGYIHQDAIADYDFWGFGDIDVVYGDIRAFYPESILRRYNTLSTIADRVSGHFFLARNQERWINAFRHIPNWQNLMGNPEHLGIDEYWFSKVLREHRLLPMPLVNLLGLVAPLKRNHLFQEQYSTPMAEWPWRDRSYQYPEQFFWYRGKLTDESGEELMYLHFMNWKSSKYLHPRYGNIAAWEKLDRIIDSSLADLSEGWCIGTSGFTPLRADFIADPKRITHEAHPD
jgi:hypothetical protein